MLELILVCQFALIISMYLIIKWRLAHHDRLIRVIQLDVDYLASKPFLQEEQGVDEEQEELEDEIDPPPSKMNIINTSSLNRLDIQSPIPRKACNSVERNNSDELNTNMRLRE